MTRLGVVEFHCSYVVDLDNQEMVEAAQTAIYDEVVAIVEDGAVDRWIDVREDETAQAAEIPEFLHDFQKFDEVDCA